jgi:hypothetical protein
MYAMVQCLIHVVVLLLCVLSPLLCVLSLFYSPLLSPSLFLRNDPYGSSKYAVDSLVIALNDEYKARGVTSYTMCPGLVMSQLTYNILPSWIWLLLMPLLFFVSSLL